MTKQNVTPWSCDSDNSLKESLECTQLRLHYQSEDIKHRDRVSKMGTIPVIMIIIDFLVVREMARKVFCRMNLSWVVYI